MSAEHSERTRHHRQARPTTHWSRDLSDTTPHEGVVGCCDICRDRLLCPTCQGSGVIVTNPEVLAFNPAALHDVACDDCSGSGQR